MKRVYKVLTSREHAEFERDGSFSGNASDVRDGFVHLATQSQIPYVLSKHFNGQVELKLLAFDEAALPSLRFEPNSKGELFPHLYGTLERSALAQQWSLNENSDLPAELSISPSSPPQPEATSTSPKAAAETGSEPFFGMRAATACAVSTGLLYFLAFPGIDIWPLSFVTWVPLLIALVGRSVKQATFLAWVSGFTMTFVGFYWLLSMLQAFSGFGAPLCVLFMVLLACYQGGRIGLFGFLYGRSVSRGWWLGPSFACAFAASEFLFPLLFPWYFGATVHQVPWLTQVADLGNPIVVGLVLCGVNYSVFRAIVAWRRKEAMPVRLCIAHAGVLLLTLAYGAFRIQQVDRDVAAAPKGVVGIVQANMGLVEKRKDREGGLLRHLKLTAELEAAGPLDLIVWPETSVAGAVYESGAEAAYRELFTSQLRTPTLVGAVLARPVEDARKYALLNSALMVNPGGQLLGSYSKHKLLAFGEYLPFGSLFPILYEWSPNTGAFNPGDSISPLSASGHPVSVHICYEDVLPSFVNQMIQEDPAELIVNMTNDAWYGDTTQPWIHMALATFRAIEHRKFFVRSTNSGVSAFVDPAGRIVQHSGTFTQAALRQEVAYLHGSTTPYELYGDAPWWLCSLFSALACGFRKRELFGKRPKDGAARLR